MRIVITIALVILAIALLGAFLSYLAPYVSRGFSVAPAPTPYQHYSGGPYTGTQSATAVHAAPYSQDRLITDEDHGTTFVYPVGTRFVVMVGGRRHGAGALSCTRPGMVREAGSELEALAPGDCAFTTRTFAVSIHVQ